MAEETKQDIELQPAKSKKKLILISLIGLVVIGIIAAGAWYFLSGDKDGTTAPVAKATPIYHEVAAPFIVNFAKQSDNQVRYLQVKLKMMAREQSVINAVALHEPAIVHNLLMLFYSQNYDDLNTAEGTQALQQATLDNINALLKSEGQPGPLEAVYFTSLVMQ
jgi:flagellar FliL protein